MFGLGKRFFAAKLMAEIKAQYDDQQFVNRLFSTDWIAEVLEMLKTQAYYRKDTNAAFIDGCCILEQGYRDETLDDQTRSICRVLLENRLARAHSDSHFWLRHILIFGGMAEILEMETNEENENDEMSLEDRRSALEKDLKAVRAKT